MNKLYKVSKINCITQLAKIHLSEILILINLILNAIYFSFNNLYYQQTIGFPLANPLFFR